MVGGGVRVDGAGVIVLFVAHDEDEAFAFEEVDGGGAVGPAVFEFFDGDALGGGEGGQIALELLGVRHGVERAVFEAFLPGSAFGFREVFDSLVLSEGALDEGDVLLGVVGEGEVAD